MFGHNRDDMVAFVGVHLGDSFESEVVGFGRAGRDDDFFFIGPNHAGNLTTRLIDRFFGGPTKGVRTGGGIAIRFGEERKHRLHHTRIGTGGRVVVQINRCLYSAHAEQPPLRFGVPETND